MFFIFLIKKKNDCSRVSEECWTQKFTLIEVFVQQRGWGWTLGHLS